jgi:hypothetical protein
MGPDLRQVRYVVAVARERNFTRAAEQLHVAQQALSQQVRGGEDARCSALRPGGAPGEADPGRDRVRPGSQARAVGF